MLVLKGAKIRIVHSSRFIVHGKNKKPIGWVSTANYFASAN